jgi:biotin operon repressor
VMTFRFDQSPSKLGTSKVRPELAGTDRRKWESGLLRRPDVQGHRRNVLRVLLTEWTWGKASCFPSDKAIAAEAGVSRATASRCLDELEQLGIIVRTGRGRGRLISFPSHPSVASRVAPQIEASDAPQIELRRSKRVFGNLGGLSRRRQPANHQVNHGDVNQRFACFWVKLVVFTQSPVSAEPSERTLNNPATR